MGQSIEDPTLELILHRSFGESMLISLVTSKESSRNQRTVVLFGLEGANVLASDSEASSIGQASTNRGKKLKRNARYVHRGRLAAEYGLTLDGAIVEYGGKLRTIIDHNPKRRRKYPQEDDEEEEEEGDHEKEPFDDDTWPYSQVNIKELLIPLAHPSELVSHPAICRIFQNNKIRVLSEQALDSLQQEHSHMTKLSRLLSVLLGDENILSEPEEMSSAPIPTMDDSDSDKDVDIIDLDDAAKETQVTNGETNGHRSSEHVTNGTEPSDTENATTKIEPQNGEPSDLAQRMDTDEQTESGDVQRSLAIEPPEARPTNGATATSRTATPSPSPTPTLNRPTTRRQTAANTRPTPADTEFSWPPPLQQNIRTTSPADFGLTPAEASEVRRMAQAALERSQEFLRCLEKVRQSLDRADKQRKMVWLWCKDSAKMVAEQDGEE